MSNTGKEKGTLEKAEGIEGEGIEELTKSYQLAFQLLSSLESGLETYSMAIDNLEMSDLDKIEKIFDCIADQFSELEQTQKKRSMEALNELIGELAASDRKGIIRDVFVSLMSISPKISTRGRRPRRC